MTDDNELLAVGLLELATGLVNSVDGSADPMSEDDERAVSAYLQRRLLQWREPSSRRDRLAWLYVDACIVEYEQRKRRDAEFVRAWQIERHGVCGMDVERVPCALPSGHAGPCRAS